MLCVRSGRDFDGEHLTGPLRIVAYKTQLFTNAWHLSACPILTVVAMTCFICLPRRCPKGWSRLVRVRRSSSNNSALHHHRINTGALTCVVCVCATGLYESILRMSQTLTHTLPPRKSAHCRTANLPAFNCCLVNSLGQEPGGEPGEPPLRRTRVPGVCPLTFGLKVSGRRLSQIKVRDLSRAQVSISPSEFASWESARAVSCCHEPNAPRSHARKWLCLRKWLRSLFSQELMTEAKRPLKAQLESETARASNNDEIKQIRVGFEQREAAIENEIDHKPRDVHISLDIEYKCACHSLNRALKACVTLLLTARLVCAQLPLEVGVQRQRHQHPARATRRSRVQ